MPPESADRVVQALPGFIKDVTGKFEDLPEGPIDVAALKRFDIVVPRSLESAGRIASPWGKAALYKASNQLTLDFLVVPPQVCPELLHAGSLIP